MAHQIEIKNGVASMMYAGQTPWHGLGQRVETEVTSAAAIKLAGLDWECEKQPMHLAGTAMIDGIPVIGPKIPEKQAVVRKEDRAVLGIVGNQYHVIQNSECFDFMDGVIGSGQAVYHTAGSLFGGRIIFLTIKLPTQAKVGDDLIDKYILLHTSHDSSSSLSVRWTPIRVVCANTAEFAFQNCSNVLNIRHSSNYQDKIAEARKTLELTEHYYSVMETEFNKMLDTKMAESEMTYFVNELFPSEQGKKVPVQTENKRILVQKLAVEGTGNAAIAGTRWAAYNAVTEYTDHYTTSRIRNEDFKNDARMNSLCFGSGYGLKKKALQLLSV
jgi:phage/plasmid-like protein (TIGR03299 family)